MGNADISWRGRNMLSIPTVFAPAPGFDIGGPWNSVEGWPECRLQGLMPLNPPNGTRASDDTVDYRDKTWSGAAWV
jgi:hypothetical protein